MTEDEYRALVTEQGYTEPDFREWPADLDGDFHTHDRSVLLYVIRGELFVVLEDTEHQYAKGDCFTLAAHTRHFERTGQRGATTLIALK